ncbi:hypothetical protein BJY01DRAFT_205302 [Aspergillus pseudoustus]|uniref:C2H2-type domain-containing protein n=1 Tax=Aspergillus pseudoustus TaxID=1810923 RepID=A0ABR4KRT0_9EURO
MNIGPYLVQQPALPNAFDPSYECTLCDRSFVSETALYSHCRFTTQHDWCERCNRVFVSSAARDEHFRASSRHNICPTCGRLQDFETAADLQRHLEDFHFCCSCCNLNHSSAEKLRLHDVAVHNLCIKCGDYFANANDLRMHQQTHQPRVMRCYGCNHTFKSFSGMLIHLESGACASRMTEAEINNLAHECYQSRKYINNWAEGWMYRCPSCYKEFVKLSALYQHAEDVQDCGHACLDKLQVWIAKSI